MINIFFNEEYGYKHWWWEYPGALDDLIEDWNSGYAPFVNFVSKNLPNGERFFDHKPSPGTLTEIPAHWDFNDPFGPGSPMMTGLSGNYTVCRAGQDPQILSCSSMDDFFQAYGEVGVDNPYLRIGEVIYPAPGKLTYAEKQEANKFDWRDHTEDPAWYQAWTQRWKASYACNSTDNAKLVLDLVRGNLAPSVARKIEAHLRACNSCKRELRRLTR